MRSLSSVLVTGGCGFIGSAFIRFLARNPSFRGRIINVDCLTYSGNLDNLPGLEGVIFEQVDIRDTAALARIGQQYKPDAIIHFAAESHVDRSISGPRDFIESNIVGTFNLLEMARTLEGFQVFHHISTDEVYGSVAEGDYFFETTPYDPRSPYAASKACSDHLVKAFSHTYKLPITLSNCSNNYGPFQYPEKLIPLTILRLLEGKTVPIYGDGKYVRDWLHVDDHAEAIWEIACRGRLGESYHVGSSNTWENIAIVEALIEIIAQQTGRPVAALRSCLSYVQDRPGHDRRYAINWDKLKDELHWQPRIPFRQGLEETVRWYREETEWLQKVQAQGLENWMQQQYKDRIQNEERGAH